jgi:hypothetical protein
MKNVVKGTKIRIYGGSITGGAAQHQEIMVQRGFQQCMRHCPRYVNLEGHDIDLQLR